MAFAFGRAARLVPKRSQAESEAEAISSQAESEAEAINDFCDALDRLDSAEFAEAEAAAADDLCDALERLEFDDQTSWPKHEPGVARVASLEALRRRLAVLRQFVCAVANTPLVQVELSVGMAPNVDMEVVICPRCLAVDPDTIYLDGSDLIGCEVCLIQQPNKPWPPTRRRNAMRCNLVIEDWNLRSAHRRILKSALEATNTYEEAARALGIRVRTLQRQIASFELSNEAARHRLAKATARPHRSKR